MTHPVWTRKAWYYDTDLIRAGLLHRAVVFAKRPDVVRKHSVAQPLAGNRL